MAHTIAFTGAGPSELTLTTEGYLGAELGDYHEANRLNCRVHLRLTGPRDQATINTTIALFTWELAAFAKALPPVYAQNTGCAEFRTLENQLNFTIEFAVSGDVKIRGTLESGGARENRLQFQLTSDQEIFAAVLQALAAATAAHPVRGF